MTDEQPTTADMTGIGPDIRQSGDVRSNSETIEAIRDGVSLGKRLGQVAMLDAFGVPHLLPIALDTDSDGTGVAVLSSAIATVDARAAGPRRRQGDVQVDDLASLIDYTNRFQHSGLAVAFAQASPPSITVIFDYDGASDGELNPPGAPGWRADRVRYACPLSRQWQTWTGKDGIPFGQAAFGDWIELNADDIGTGEGFADAATMLAVARSLAIYDKGTIHRQINPTTGEGTLVVQTEHDVKSTKIPRAFQLAIPVFEGSTELYPVEARVRFALDRNTGAASFAYVLHNRAQVYEHAVRALRLHVEQACGIPVFVGKAPPPVEPPEL